MVAISPTQWRVSDATKDESDGMALLGFVERINQNKFEVTTLGRPCDSTYLPSFKAALDSLAIDQPGGG